jgi:hypothetical protein
MPMSVLFFVFDISALFSLGCATAVNAFRDTACSYEAGRLRG